MVVEKNISESVSRFTYKFFEKLKCICLHREKGNLEHSNTKNEVVERRLQHSREPTNSKYTAYIYIYIYIYVYGNWQQHVAYRKLVGRKCQHCNIQQIAERHVIKITR